MPDPKQRLVDQEATNAQTIQFVADQQADIASQADALAKEEPEFARVAALEREHRKTLQEVASEDHFLATEIQFSTEETCGSVAADIRENRKDLLEIARAESRLGEELLSMAGDDPTVAVLAEQAQRNCDLLRHAAKRETQADQGLRQDEPPVE